MKLRDGEYVEVARLRDGTMRITIVAEECEQGCGERVRYWNDDAGNGNASCGCCTEGPEACDPVVYRPSVERLLEDALRAVRALC